jgi:uncharacterized lipoprotein YddW (UPF0748 family)
MKKIICFLLLGFACMQVHAQKKQAKKKSETPFKGVWLTNTGSDAMYTQKGIQECVDICAAAGLQHIFMVTWNRGVTQFKSKVMKQEFGIEMDTTLKGFDPLAALIKAAHKKGLKVHAWMEFGFSNALDGSGQFILDKHPDWASKTKDGKVLLDNGFTWMNPFHPAVRDFMKRIMVDMVTNYDLDGVQGDDRLPALPSSGGYDEYTVNLYKKEHNGKAPPDNRFDSAWVQWRCDILSAYVPELHKAIKAVRKSIMITLAPHVYPWGKENYLQDWPKWLKDGYVEYVFPQVYRYDLEKYTKSLNEMLKQSASYKDIVVPGVLIALGNGFLIKEDLLQQMIEANRKAGLKGEMFFYFDGVKKLKKFFTEVYPKL